MNASEEAPFVRVLDGRGPDASQLGGKAAAIDRLLAIGTPVPPSAVLTAAAYRAFVNAGQAPLIHQLAGPGGTVDGDQRQIDQLFASMPMPEAVEQAIVESGRTVRAAGAARLVVRSSATAEDLDSASFAGQYRSVLDVDDDAGLLRAVRLVWASLWHPAPRTYRRLRGMDDEHVAMAVLVMGQVDARWSGVVFTSDPGGQPGCARIEMVRGLADRLVSGAVTPTAYVVRRDDPSSGLPDIAAEAVRGACAISDAFGVPQDVEWAHDGSRLWIVQARPITASPDPASPDQTGSGDGFDSVVDERSTYTTAGIPEALPGVLPPLAWSTAGQLTDSALRNLISSVGGATPPGPVVKRVRGRAVLDLTAMHAATATLPPGVGDRLEAEYAANGPASDSSDRGSAATHQRGTRRHALRVLRAQHRGASQAEITIRAIDEITQTAVDLTARSDSQLLALHHRTLDLAGRAATAQAQVAAVAEAAAGRLDALLHGWYEDQTAVDLAQRLTSGVTSPGTLNTVPVAGLDGDQLHQAATRAGSRAYFGGPTWAEDLDMAAIVAKAPLGENAREPQALLDEVAQELVSRHSWKATRVVTGQVVDIRLTMLRRAVTEARDGLERRERAKAALLRLGGLTRRIHLELGRRLTAAGALAAPSDIDLLGAHELAAAVAGAGPDRISLLKRRRRLREAAALGPLPHVFTGVPPPQPQSADQGSTYSGWGASRGVAEGPARVLTAPCAGVLAPGEVLVATSTDASWTPLFLDAAALVVEEGGPLSHAAICARELGLPAVVNVPGIVARLRSGESRVRVDGSTGTVSVLDPETETAPARFSRSALAEIADEWDEPSPTVFVPAIMGIGVVVSLAIGLSSLVQTLMRKPGTGRRSRLVAHQTARMTVDGERAATEDRLGLRSRTFYRLAGLAFVAMGLYVGIGEVANYFRVADDLFQVAWVLTIALIVALVFLWSGVLTLRAAVSYDAPPPDSRAFLSLTPMVSLPDGQGAHVRWHRRGPPHPTHHRALNHVVLGTVAHRWLQRMARVFSVVVLALILGIANFGDVTPRNPQFATYQDPALTVLLVVFAVAAVFALRWEGLGGGIMLFAATLIWVLAAREYAPSVAFVAFAVLAVPGVLHLLGWQRTRSLAAVLLVGAIVMVLATAGGIAALRLHAYGFGPTHPESVAANPPVDVIEWAIAGGTTSRTTTVKARLTEPTTAATLLVSLESDLDGARRFGPVAATTDTDQVATFAVDGLQPERTYYYAVEVDGRVEAARRGSVTTFPEGAASFAFAFANCAQAGSNGAVFDAIRAKEPLFYLQTGDLFYGDVAEDDPAAYAALFSTTWSSPGQAALYRSTSFAYMWDDHDYDGNDADRTAASRPAALSAYRAYVPHYPLALDGEDAPVAQAFTVGRVRVILFDGRSARSPGEEPDGPDKTMLGKPQREWLIRELNESSRTHGFVVVVSASPWIIRENTSGDSWAAYATERRMIADAVERTGVANVLMLAGDAHMVAIDDGSNNTFSSSGRPLFPVFHAGPLDRPPSDKGGPYSEGVVTEPGKFGLVEIDDDGTRIRVSLTAWSWDGSAVPVALDWEVPAPEGTG